MCVGQGDSGFLLARGGALVFKSPSLQHFFDCPYQFGACPEYVPFTDYADSAAVFKARPSNRYLYS